MLVATNRPCRRKLVAEPTLRLRSRLFQRLHRPCRNREGRRPLPSPNNQSLSTPSRHRYRDQLNVSPLKRKPSPILGAVPGISEVTFQALVALGRTPTARATCVRSDLMASSED